MDLLSSICFDPVEIDSKGRIIVAGRKVGNFINEQNVRIGDKIYNNMQMLQNLEQILNYCGQPIPETIIGGSYLWQVDDIKLIRNFGFKGNIYFEEYKKNNMLHNANGPAYICTGARDICGCDYFHDRPLRFWCINGKQTRPHEIKNSAWEICNCTKHTIHEIAEKAPAWLGDWPESYPCFVTLFDATKILVNSREEIPRNIAGNILAYAVKYGLKFREERFADYVEEYKKYCAELEAWEYSWCVAAGINTIAIGKFKVKIDKQSVLQELLDMRPIEPILYSKLTESELYLPAV